MPSKIVITITADGKITGEVNGVKGSSCEGLLKELEELGVMQNKSKTSEFYEKPIQNSLKYKGGN